MPPYHHMKTQESAHFRIAASIPGPPTAPINCLHLYRFRQLEEYCYENLAEGIHF